MCVYIYHNYMTVEYMLCTDVIKTKTHVLKIQDKTLKYGSKVSPSPTGDYTACLPSIALCWPTSAHPLPRKFIQPTSCWLICEHLCAFLMLSICLLARKAWSQKLKILDRFSTLTEMCIHILVVQFISLWIHVYFLK